MSRHLRVAHGHNDAAVRRLVISKRSLRYEEAMDVDGPTIQISSDEEEAAPDSPASKQGGEGPEKESRSSSSSSYSSSESETE